MLKLFLECGIQQTVIFSRYLLQYKTLLPHHAATITFICFFVLRFCSNYVRMALKFLNFEAVKCGGILALWV